MKFKQQILFLVVMVITATAFAEKNKVLYVTHEPGRWHKYTPQLAIFKEIGEKAGHDVSDWNAEPFQNLNIDGVNYMAGE